MNAKEEFLEHIKFAGGKENLLCASIKLDKIEAYLTTEYTEEEYEEFLNSLDIQYDSGYGSQNMYGDIWYKDGTWSDRGEYDGSECWNHMKMPTIREELRNYARERDVKINDILIDDLTDEN
jgi:hypothetical protein